MGTLTGTGFAAACGLAATLALAIATWVASLVKRDVSIVDSMWSVLIVAAGIAYVTILPQASARTMVALVLAVLWALRLSIYITWRNWGEAEDHRYQAIRRRNDPGFAIKSIYLVFALQAVLAWIVSMSLLVTAASPRPMDWMDAPGIVLVLFGLVFEAIGDQQLARFKSDPANRGHVMDRGLWRFTRHPNYFGEFCVWWGFYLLAASAGGRGAIVSPLLMSVLLLKVSGVGLLEKDIGERRPAYRDYIARTNAFFPGPPKT
jgi:steroid 5-alpha reductase family enzyme